jgi:uncharacterized repeat protein (TIGR03803 family)
VKFERLKAPPYRRFGLWILTFAWANFATASLSSAATLTTLASFNPFDHGANSRADLIADAAGNVYGTTTSLGPSGLGAIFRLDAGASTVTTLVSLNGNKGGSPLGRLIADAAGNLYGTASVGGAGCCGTVFRLDAGMNALTTLTSFIGANGAYPQSGLIADAAGNLYGTTAGGGTSDRGTVFRLQLGANTHETLASFNGSNGAIPVAGLIADAAGNLYGTTAQGGASDRGAVFRLAAGVNTLDALASFTGANGENPRGALIADAAGNLFGTTSKGGSNGLGTIFRLDVDSNTITTLASFNGLNGANPNSGLIADAAGNLFGTTESGGASNLGTVFRLDSGSNSITTLASFNRDNGAHPYAGLIVDAAGNLYGTTSDTVFRLSEAGFVVPEPMSPALMSAASVLLFRRRRVVNNRAALEVPHAQHVIF